MTRFHRARVAPAVSPLRRATLLLGLLLSLSATAEAPPTSASDKSADSAESEETDKTRASETRDKDRDKSEPPDPLSGSLISLRVVGGMTPYRQTSYEVLWRARVAVASHYRGLVNYGEALHQMSLVPREEYAALLKTLDGLGVYELDKQPVAPVMAGALTYEIEVSDGKRKVELTVTEPRALDDGRYAQIIDTVRQFVVRTAGDLTFRNVFFEPGTFGYANLTSVPTARVFIDGRDTRRSTPLYGYELPAGKHEVRIVAEKEKWERTHTLTIQPGMTTIVHFDLR